MTYKRVVCQSLRGVYIRGLICLSSLTILTDHSIYDKCVGPMNGNINYNFINYTFKLFHFVQF